MVPLIINWKFLKARIQKSSEFGKVVRIYLLEQERNEGMPAMVRGLHGLWAQALEQHYTGAKVISEMHQGLSGKDSSSW